MNVETLASEMVKYACDNPVEAKRFDFRPSGGHTREIEVDGHKAKVTFAVVKMVNQTAYHLWIDCKAWSVVYLLKSAILPLGTQFNADTDETKKFIQAMQ
jgi:hypothetical protein